jgi:hypothetical protein
VKNFGGVCELGCSGREIAECDVEVGEQRHVVTVARITTAISQASRSHNTPTCAHR